MNLWPPSRADHDHARRRRTPVRPRCRTPANPCRDIQPGDPGDVRRTPKKHGRHRSPAETASSSRPGSAPRRPSRPRQRRRQALKFSHGRVRLVRPGIYSPQEFKRRLAETRLRRVQGDLLLRHRGGVCEFHRFTIDPACRASSTLSPTSAPQNPPRDDRPRGASQTCEVGVVDRASPDLDPSGVQVPRPRTMTRRAPKPRERTTGPQ